MPHHTIVNEFDQLNNCFLISKRFRYDDYQSIMFVSSSAVMVFSLMEFIDDASASIVDLCFCDHRNQLFCSL